MLIININGAINSGKSTACKGLLKLKNATGNMKILFLLIR